MGMDRSGSRRRNPRRACVEGRAARRPAEDRLSASGNACAVTLLEIHAQSSISRTRRKRAVMQFGIFTVGDIAPDPVTGRTQSEAERIQNIVRVAKRADEVELDVFALGEHHNPPFVPSSPTTLLGHIAAQTEGIILSTSVTLMTTNDPVRLAEDYAMLQHVARGRLDLMVGRGNTFPVYAWFGQDIREGVAL